MSNSSLSENTSINNDTDTPPNPLTPPPSPVSPNEKPIARFEATESSTPDEINAETELETETEFETEAKNEIETKTDIQTDIQTDTQNNENVILKKNCLVIQILTYFICYLNIIRKQKSKRMMNRMKMPKMMRLFQMVIQYHTFRH